MSVPTSGKLKCHQTVDKMNRFALADSHRLLKKISDEADVLLEQRRLQEEEVRNIFEQHMESWEPAEKKIESIVEQELSKSPKAVIQKERIWNKTRTLCCAWRKKMDGRKTTRT